MRVGEKKKSFHCLWLSELPRAKWTPCKRNLKRAVSLKAAVTLQINAKRACAFVCDNSLPHRAVSTWHPSRAELMSSLWWLSLRRGSPSQIACEHRCVHENQIWLKTQIWTRVEKKTRKKKRNITLCSWCGHSLSGCSCMEKSPLGRR